MDLVQKLEKRAKELDIKVKASGMLGNYYRMVEADDRELLEQAVAHIRNLEKNPWLKLIEKPSWPEAK